MIKYSKDNIPCRLLGTFNIRGELKARIEEVLSQKIHVLDYFKYMSEDFYLLEDKEVIELQASMPDTHVAVVTEIEPKNFTNIPKEVVEDIALAVAPVMVKATTPKGKIVKFKLDEIESFCEKHNLDIQAVELVLNGSQKTHKKWGFVTVE